MSAGERLTELQNRAIAALVTTRTVVEAAEQVGCGESTVRRWLAEPRFREEYRQASRKAAAGAISAVLAAQLEAVETLRAELRGDSAVQRVRAARVLLEVGARALDQDMDERLDQIEERLQAWDARGPLGLTG